MNYFILKRTRGVVLHSLYIVYCIALGFDDLGSVIIDILGTRKINSAPLMKALMLSDLLYLCLAFWFFYAVQILQD